MSYEEKIEAYEYKFFVSIPAVNIVRVVVEPKTDRPITTVSYTHLTLPTKA